MSIATPRRSSSGNTVAALPTTPIARAAGRAWRPGSDDRVVQVVGHLVEVPLGHPAAQPRLVDVDARADAAVQRDGERLGPAHAAAAGGEGERAGQRAAEPFRGHRGEGLVGALEDSLGADVDPGAGGHLAGTITLTAGLGGMGGAQPLAVTMNDGVRSASTATRRAIAAVSSTATWTRRPTTWTTRSSSPSRPATRPAAAVHRPARQRRRPVPPAARRAPRSTSSPTRPPPTTRWPTCPTGSTSTTGRLRGEEARGVHRPGPRVHGHARRGDGRLPGRRRRGLRLRQLHPRRGPARRLRPGVRLPRLRARLHPPAVLRGQGPVPLGRAVRRPERHRHHRPGDPRPLPGERATCTAGSSWPASGSHFQGLPARICWLGYGERDKAGVRFNEMVASGELSAPIVIGRDHLDSGSVASPYRETEAHGRRLRRDRRLAAAERPGQRRLRRLLGVDPPRRRRRHGPLHPRRPGLVADGTPLAGAEDPPGPHQRPGHGRHPPRRRRLRHRRVGRRRARRAGPDAEG